MDNYSGYTNPAGNVFGHLTFPPAPVPGPVPSGPAPGAYPPTPASGQLAPSPNAVVPSYQAPETSYQAPVTSSYQAPQVEQMMESTAGQYQGFITGMGNFHEVHERYLAIHDRAAGDSSDFPMDSDAQRELVKQLFEAAHDCSQTYEPEGSQSLKRIRQGGYTDLEYELVLWPLLISTRDAQAGQCRLPNYLYCREPPYNSYGSFGERFEAVREALKLSKDVVVSLFKDATFKHRLAWRPKAELNKATNRKLNGERDVQNAIGLRVALENGIKTNKDGELVDRNGQTYGNVKKRSTAFEVKVTKTKKRGSDTKRGEFSKNVGLRKGATDSNNPSTHDQEAGVNDTEQSATRPVPAQLVRKRIPDPLVGYGPNNTSGHITHPMLPSTVGQYSQSPAPSMESYSPAIPSPCESNNPSSNGLLFNNMQMPETPVSMTGFDPNFGLSPSVLGTPQSQAYDPSLRPLPQGYGPDLYTPPQSATSAAFNLSPAAPDNTQLSHTPAQQVPDMSGVAQPVETVASDQGNSE